MSIEIILSIMDRLEKMHKSLLKLAYNKTEFIKTGDMDGLNQLLKDEQSHVAAITQLELQRQQKVTDYLEAKGIAHAEHATVAQVMEVANNPEEHFKLDEARKKLLLAIETLKHQNELNQKIIFQSLQFVNLTLDMLRPRPDQINYSSNNARGSNNSKENTYFDSQA
ncbi:flagellar protein FlgN [Viridibacillus sp. YIM B01967]|uniref:Flagellar protein FlgN n=1 Tax=Viridibacillus soli TaxID=2798301 RepID=A0ABS1H5Y5_9BACL|nr:flagellar protein FlgN [Viridibacillus soli]MBK3494824.1 flagellar protein FlgN [Viridibacillus soli]